MNDFLTERNEATIVTGISVETLIKRTNLSARLLNERFGIFSDFTIDVIDEINIEVKYSGYIEKQLQVVEKNRKLENRPLSKDLDYSTILGLRIEAQQKLNEVKPLTIGQASRISGVSPADISVLLFNLK